MINYFNSIKVQLELNPYFALGNIQSFQFHKGTIRTGGTWLRSDATMVFQFHKGTIRTVKLIDSVCWLSNFNSIKVQLELFVSKYEIRF